MKPTSVLLAAFGLLTLGVRVGAQARPYVPPVGSAERKAIMDTLRGPVEEHLHRPVIFRVQNPAQDFHVQNGWAFVQAQLRQPNGARMGRDFYARQGDVSDLVMALLRRQGGRWHIVTYALCPTDVAWEGWDRRYHAPRAIFPRIGRG
ncbi:MAG: hypothetical protein JO250_11780 [Armatimonadetes bacterium]|nr:hypothetical protein [Armatimonadota bacterium]